MEYCGKEKRQERRESRETREERKENREERREKREERREKREERREKKGEKRESEPAHVNARRPGLLEIMDTMNSAFCFVFPSSRSARAFRRHPDLAPPMGCGCLWRMA